MRSIALAICVVAFWRVSSGAYSFDYIDVNKDFEITSRADGGFFSSIHSIAIDEDNQELYVLHDYPLMISAYYLRDGNPLWIQELGKEIVEPASVTGCAGRLFIISQRKLWELTNKKELVPVNTAPDGTQARADILLCYAPNGLLLVNQESKRVEALAWNGMTLPVATPVKDAGGKKTLVPFLKAEDAALTINGDICIADSGQRAIRIITPGKTKYKSFPFASADDSLSRSGIVAIDTDSSGNAWAVNDDDNALDVYGPLGDLRYRVSQTDDNGFRFVNPTDIIIDSADKIYLLDDGTNTIKVFEVGQK